MKGNKKDCMLLTYNILENLRSNEANFHFCSRSITLIVVSLFNYFFIIFLRRSKLLIMISKLQNKLKLM